MYSERCIRAGTLTVNYEKVDVDYRLKHNDLLANIVHRGNSSFRTIPGHVEKLFEPQLQQENNMGIVFQQDGAPPHWATDVRDYLDDNLTPPDFFLWGFVKNDVYAQRLRDIHDLRAKIFSAFEKVTPEMLGHTWEELATRYELCRVRNGGQVEV
ncbi:hypothetical protein ANN_11948 [Periplaneta americana]|uniref:Uncharacterized protein n=1 Tax=Periplaneta americana TaxID=6978 RepID=A0ABQ8T8B8_PERAM|nr:hypothetical protein ANN_11948 [Periplaneta americana]